MYDIEREQIGTEILFSLHHCDTISHRTPTYPVPKLQLNYNGVFEVLGGWDGGMEEGW